MYQVLYRKWRPQTFSEVVGQETVTKALCNEVSTGRLAHAYLFVGSRGTGKTSCAKILAKAVNCLHPVDGNPCGECEICRGIDDGSILDVVEMDAASNNGVDDARELRDEVAFMPSVAKYRVYIIDEAHMITRNAFNALLKTLEEPPAHVIFILATTEVQALPETVLSRCQRFDFGRITVENIVNRMQAIAESENFTLDDDAAQMLARLADGGMRDALSILEQCVSRGNHVTIEVVTEVAGLAGREHMFELADAMIKQDGGAALSIIDRLHNASKDMERLCSECLDFFRQMMICKQVPNPGELIILPKHELEALEAMAENFTMEQVLYSLDILQKSYSRLRGGVSRRLEMEMTFMKLCTPALDSGSESLLRRVKALEQMVKGGMATGTLAPAKETPQKTVSETTTKPVTPPPSEEKPEAPKPQKPMKAKEKTPFLQWPEVVQILSEENPPLYGMVAESSAYISEDYVVIQSDLALTQELIKKDGNSKIICDAIARVTGTQYRLAFQLTKKVETEENDPLSAFLRESMASGIQIDLKGE